MKESKAKKDTVEVIVKPEARTDRVKFDGKIIDKFSSVEVSEKILENKKLKQHLDVL